MRLSEDIFLFLWLGIAVFLITKDALNEVIWIQWTYDIILIVVFGIAFLIVHHKTKEKEID